ncbi:MAG: carnitine dehydratase [Rhodobiaceae bacterium]|nr:MAG: carnitine dehydratase [Rhodobiaceae bacterium]
MTDTAPTTPAGPFSGLKVIDLTRVLAGPYCTMVLADLGAEVVKVEMPGRGDDARHIGPFIDGKSAYFMSLNRGKQSIALNLKDEADRKTFETLLETADVLVENYRAGTLDKLGYSWETLHAKYPKLILASASGFGQTGPYKEKPAYDMVVQAMGGIMSLTGHEGNPPTRVGSSIGDITAGLFTAIGIGSALYHRAMTQEALRIDVSMLDSQLAILENGVARYVATGQIPGPLGSRHPSIAPFQAFEVADGHIVIAAGNDILFARMAKAIGCIQLIDDDRFASNELRCENGIVLAEIMERVLKSQPSTHWLDILDAAGVPNGPINNVEQALNDPQILARNMVISTDDPDIGTLKMAGNPIKISGFADPSKRPAAPALDGDRADILKKL